MGWIEGITTGDVAWNTTQETTYYKPLMYYPSFTPPLNYLVNPFVGSYVPKCGLIIVDFDERLWVGWIL